MPTLESTPLQSAAPDLQTRSEASNAKTSNSAPSLVPRDGSAMNQANGLAHVVKGVDRPVLQTQTVPTVDSASSLAAVPDSQPRPEVSNAKSSNSAPGSLGPHSGSAIQQANGHTHGVNGAESLSVPGDVDAECGGCHKVIEQDSGEVVIALGTSLWHVDCFRCAKCKDRISAATDLILLSDGTPICGNCSYQCFVCKQPITEEAIMTGDESYHAHCFTCRTCKRRIEELVFAKTSQGTYCMACHNERVARSRRNAEAKRQRAARKGKDKVKEREREESQRSQEEPRLRSASPNPPAQASLNSPVPVPQPAFTSPIASPAATPNNYSIGRFDNHVSPQGGSQSEQSSDEAPRQRELSVAHALNRAGSPAGRQIAENLPLPASPNDPHVPRDRSPSGRGQAQQSSPSLGGQAPLGLGSPSFPPSTLRAAGSIGLGVGLTPSGLGVPTSRAEKRRSINPAMTFNMDAQNSTFSAEPRLSPLPHSPLRTSFTDMQNNAVLRSPTSPSPDALWAEGFPFKTPVLGSGGAQVTPRAGDQPPPPRTSSLPDQLAIKDDSPRSDSPPAVGTTQPLNLSHHESTTPRLIAPDLPPMSFSLSDPDFASILNNIEHSPHRSKTPQAVPPVRRNTDQTDSSPSSPHGGSSPTLARSPQADQLSSALDDSIGALGIYESRSPSRSRLSPHDSAPQLLRTRQPSAESTTSVTSKLGSDSAFGQIISLLAAAKHTGANTIPIDTSILDGIVAEVEDLNQLIQGLKNKYTGAKRTSQQYSEGLTVAGEEYDKELALRHELEAEVMRLRAQVHSQTARLSVISGDERRQENMRRRSNDLASSLSGLEKDISRLRAQRDMTLAEVEELNVARLSLDGSTEDAATNLSQSLTNRLDTIKEQYREELEPLTAQREALQREIAELRETKESFLEESTALAAKNEELAELNASLTRQAEAIQDSMPRIRPLAFNKGRSHPSGSPSLSSLATSATLQEVPEETARVVKVTKPEPIEAAPARRFKWYKSSRGPDMSSASASISKPLALPPDRNKNQRPSTEFGIREHTFQQHSSMRLTRCELCAEKMWGLQEVRCSSCGMVCHSKCAEKLPKSCPGGKNGVVESIDGPLPPSMFGRDLPEQVNADKAPVPVIVTKCISAVEAVGMDFEGIYRKTGGSSQSKQITQLFERGEYDSFDLADIEAFNDISSVTSVLKTYFRQLPNPLLTHKLHESFVAAASIRDTNNRHSALCALLKELPKDHYNTLRTLMLHLNRVTAQSSVNLMTSQNLGVVFGPTLMRSSDPNREFGDMAGKAISVQWMVDNAPAVFEEARL